MRSILARVLLCFPTLAVVPATAASDQQETTRKAAEAEAGRQCVDKMVLQFPDLAREKIMTACGLSPEVVRPKTPIEAEEPVETATPEEAEGPAEVDRVKSKKAKASKKSHKPQRTKRDTIKAKQAD